MIEINEPLPGMTRQQTGRLIATLTDRTCGEGCWKAKEEVCRCECGGKNHGIQLRTGQGGVRACKIKGVRYELASVGRHRELGEEGARLTAEAWLERGDLTEIGYSRKYRPYERSDLFYIDTATGKEEVKGWIRMHHLKGGGDLYAVKYASLAQCLKWEELAYFEVADERDRIKSDAAILWKQVNLVS